MALPFGISATDAFLVSITSYSIYLLSIIPLSALFFVGQGGTAAVHAETKQNAKP